VYQLEIRAEKTAKEAAIIEQKTDNILNKKQDNDPIIEADIEQDVSPDKQGIDLNFGLFEIEEAIGQESMPEQPPLKKIDTFRDLLKRKDSKISSELHTEGATPKAQSPGDTVEIAKIDLVDEEVVD